jgi:hypothetical protein
MVGKFDDIAMVAVQREERECIDECELLTPKRLERCRKKGQRTQKQKGYTHVKIGSGMMLCVLLITLPHRTSHV